MPMGNYKHGMEGTSTYRCWANILDRCINPDHPNYRYYGGRGITVCERWMEFRNFYEDMSDRPKGMWFDRKDNDGNYEPENCHWITPSESAKNRRLARDKQGRFSKLAVL